MSELATTNNNNVPAIPSGDSFLTKGAGDFLPSIKLIHGISPEAGKIKPGNFLLGETDLGDKFNCAVVGKRAHALHIKDKKKYMESYDISSRDFMTIANVKNRDTKTETVLFGLEFLCYVFSVGKFGTMFFGANSNREQGGRVELLTTPVEARKANPTKFPEITWGFPYTRVLTFTSEMRQFGASFRALVPVAAPCSDGDAATNMPSENQIAEAVLKFTPPTMPESVKTYMEEKTKDDMPFER